MNERDTLVLARQHTSACDCLGETKRFSTYLEEYFHFVTCLTQSPRGERYKERQRERKKTDTDKDRKKKYRANEKHKMDRNIKQNRERCHKMKK